MQLFVCLNNLPTKGNSNTPSWQQPIALTTRTRLVVFKDQCSHLVYPIISTIKKPVKIWAQSVIKVARK